MAGAGARLKTLDDTRRVRGRVLGVFEMAEQASDPTERAAWLTFAVVGGGPTGVELSGQIADLAHRTLRHDYRDIDTARARVVLLEAGPDVLPAYPPSLRGRAARDLGKLGVEVRVGATAMGVDPGGVTISRCRTSRASRPRPCRRVASRRRPSTRASRDARRARPSGTSTRGPWP